MPTPAKENTEQAYVELLLPAESESRLKKLYDCLKPPGIHWEYQNDRTGQRFFESPKSPERFIGNLLKLFLLSHHAVMQKINCRSLSSRVAWDALTKLPSHPTLIADAEAYAAIIKPENKILRILARSFASWQTFSKDDFKCACGSGLRFRDIQIEVLVRTIVKREKNGLSLVSLAGSRSDSTEHQKNHYNGFSQPSNEDASIQIISCVESVITPDEHEISGLMVANNSAKEFNRDLFWREVEGAVKAIESESTL